ncbi:MAG: response regulator [Candidatus Yanofskybacteria bacterium]|nr:response regulator [Candidatus Yanofskybacteria bacterium]
MEEHKNTVLVIEDEEALAKILEDQLLLSGFSVRCEHNGKDGYEAALAMKPDLILLDLLLPKMNGMTVLRNLRKDPWGKNARVIVLTNVNILHEIAGALGKDEFDYIVKSDHTVEDIITKVKERILSPATP